MKRILLTSFILLSVIILNAQIFNVQESSSNRVRVHCTAAPMEVTNVSTPAGNFSRLTMEGAALSSEVGQPQVPVAVSLLEIPLCSGVRCEVISSHFTDYSAAELGVTELLFPAQPSYAKSVVGELPLIKDAATYQRDEFYHRDLAVVEKTGILRNMNIATLYFSPIQYNPVTRTIRVYDDVEISVEFDNPDLPATYAMKSLHGNAFFSGLQHRVLNPMQPQNREDVYNRPIKMLIVAHSMFRGQLDGFIAWKQRQGLVVDVAYTDDAQVGTTTTSISNFIKSLYTYATDDNPAPSFVLLVGDVAQIPAFSTHVSGESHVTDLYYFTWTDGDNVPDCYYGRFSAQNANQLANILDKTLQYEQYTMPDPSYLDDAVLVAGTDANFGPTHANGQINYLANNYVNTAFGYSNVYVHLYNSSSQAATIRAEIGAGVGYANYTAHCSPSGWADPEFETNHIPSMNNADKYGFMVGNCCQSNQFNDDECFGEALLRAEKKGAVGYIGGSNSTYWGEDYYWSVGYRANIVADPTYDANNLGAYDRMFHTHGEQFSDWTVTAGSILMGGNLSVEASPSDSKLYYWEIYHLMGDPTLLPWFTNPDPMPVSVGSDQVAGLSSLAVQAVPYAYVALTENGTVIGASMADATGMANLSFNPLIPGSAYELAATAQGYQPFFQTINVVDPTDAYVVALNPQLAASNDPNYNATVSINATLRNLGVADASDITATLSTTSSEVTIVENTATLASLAVEQQQLLTNAFSVYIHDDIADNTMVPFTITTTFNNNLTTECNFNLTLKAPILSGAGASIAEVEGNGNNAINPGETVSLRITTNNAGHAPAADVYSHLTCFYDQVTIVNDDLSLGNIDAMGNAVSEFTIQISENVPEPFIVPFIHNVYAGAYSYTDTVYLFVGECVEDFETGDFSKFNWTNSSNAWSVGNGAYEGSYCAVSKSNLSSGSSCTLSLSVTATANDTISYYRKYTAGSSWFGSDNFTFYIDNNVMETVSSTANWSRAAFPISAGTHTIRFVFTRDSYGGSSSTARIDYINFPMNGDMAPLAVEEAQRSLLNVYPVPATQQVTIALPSSDKGYQLVLFDMNGRQIQHRTITGGSSEYQLNINDLRSGLYLISLYNEDGVWTGKIVRAAE